MELDAKLTVLNEGETIDIPPNVRHRAKAIKGDTLVLEISYGDFEESDIVRLEDDYNRATKSV